MQNLSNKARGLGMYGQIAIVLILCLLYWGIGAPTFFSSANAAQLTQLSHTLGDSDLGVVSSSTIRFTATEDIAPLETIKVQLDPTTSAFSQSFTTSTSTEVIVTVAGTTDYDVVTACTAGNQMTLVGNYNGGSDENLTFTLCSGATLIATSSAVSIWVGGSILTNPASPGSYVTRIGGTMSNSGDARVAIIDDVVVTASVDTTFTFTITGMATSTTVNGTSTTITTTATAIPFGTLSPNQPKVASQRLNVSTNATNGFVVTVSAGRGSSGTLLANGGALTSSAGDDIDFFQDSSKTDSPANWAAPSNTLGNESTYGHWGLTTSDSDSGYGFGSDQWVGSFWATTTRAVFAHTGPTDGTTTNIGSTTVGYAIQIGSLQQAGNDYQTTLTYVATPTF